jgi:hypothetical protein
MVAYRVALELRNLGLQAAQCWAGCPPLAGLGDGWIDCDALRSFETGWLSLEILNAIFGYS